MKNIGAIYTEKGDCRFRLFAPLKTKVDLQIIEPFQKCISMNKEVSGNFTATVLNAPSNLRYHYIVEDGAAKPDPASHYQPEGVFGPSEAVNHQQFKWSDEQWMGRPFRDLIIYELHVGTFTDEGSFDAIIDRLPDLKETGINAIELMPVSQFTGHRNWGYDGVFPFSVHNSYGGPEGLKRLVNACHREGIAVFLDVVYNHIGPEGNCLPGFAPYFSSVYHTPWGDAMNFDGKWSDGVKNYVIQSVRNWIINYHIDGLRFDAIHEMFDRSAENIWLLLHEERVLMEQQLGRPLYFMAESDLNNPSTIKHPDAGGMGFHAQWLDDFHHALYVLINPDDRNRYRDFEMVEQLAKAYKEGFVHSGEYVNFRKKRHGRSSAGISGEKFIAFNQNHDQIGNRPGGERLSHLVDFDTLKLAAAALMLSPYVPLLFMGEEYADDSPFLFFVSHSDMELVEKVREGRKVEFADFGEFDAPDPYSEETFEKCKIKWGSRKEGRHKILLQWYKTLIEMRRTEAPLREFSKNTVNVQVVGDAAYLLSRKNHPGSRHILAWFNFGKNEVRTAVPNYADGYSLLLNSRSKEWMEKEGEATVPQTIESKHEITLLPQSLVVYKSDAV